MINGKIIIAGGSGFIGQELINYFGKTNPIVILTRSASGAKQDHPHKQLSSDGSTISSIRWDGQNGGEWATQLEGAAAIINLAGKSVNCRYTEKNKREIIDSRVLSTNVIGQAILQCKKPPPLWINASSATIYREAFDRPQDEISGEYGEGFSVEVCKAWESAFYEPVLPRTRRAALRFSIALGNGGALNPYFNLLKFGLGGTQARGDQEFSWIHIGDLCRMVGWIADHPHLEGSFICSSPAPVTNREFMKQLRKATGHRLGLPAATWMLKLGAAIIGTEAELIVKSRWVMPARILDSGFQFSFPQLDQALKQIVSTVPKSRYRLFGI